MFAHRQWFAGLEKTVERLCGSGRKQSYLRIAAEANVVQKRRDVIMKTLREISVDD